MQKLIDELGTLEAELVPRLLELGPKIARMKLLQGMIADQAPEGPQSLRGELYGAAISEAAVKRTFPSMPRLYRTLGHKEFMAKCSFPLGTFDQFVKSGIITKTDAAVLLHEEHTGNRIVKTFKLPSEVS